MARQRRQRLHRQVAQRPEHRSRKQHLHLGRRRQRRHSSSSETFFVSVSNVTAHRNAKRTGLGTIVNDDVTVIRIHDVQGTGTASPMVGQSVTLQGIVTANFQAATSLGGFYIQEEDANIDADPATSKASSYFTPATAVAVGDKVTVTGTVAGPARPPTRSPSLRPPRCKSSRRQSAAGAGGCQPAGCYPG